MTLKHLDVFASSQPLYQEMDVDQLIRDNALSLVHLTLHTFTISYEPQPTTWHRFHHGPSPLLPTPRGLRYHRLDHLKVKLLTPETVAACPWLRILVFKEAAPGAVQAVQSLSTLSSMSAPVALEHDVPVVSGLRHLRLHWVSERVRLRHAIRNQPLLHSLSLVLMVSFVAPGEHMSWSLTEDISFLSSSQPRLQQLRLSIISHSSLVLNLTHLNASLQQLPCLQELSLHISVRKTRQQVYDFLSLLSTLSLKRLQLNIEWTQYDGRLFTCGSCEEQLKELVQEMEEKKGCKLNYEYDDLSDCDLYTIWEP